MATKKKKTKTTATKKTTPKKKPATKKKTLKTAGKVTARKKVQKKNQVQKKTRKEKTGKVTKPAKKPVRKVKAKGPKATPKRVARKKNTPADRVKITRVSRKTPSETTRAATPLSPRKELLRKQLIEKREEIVREAKAEIAKYIKGEANELAETALDDGDWSVIDLSADLNLRRLETHRERLLGIDAAILKLKEGTYGICEECGGEITAERLRVMPFAIYCRDCQEKKEEIDKITREESLS